jgi:hypothetical protein
VVVILLLFGLTAVGAVLAKMQCVDAAREAARAAARGESGEAAGRRAAPDGASVSVDVDGDTARAVVRADAPSLVPFIGSFTVTAEAVAATEPGDLP